MNIVIRVVLQLVLMELRAINFCLEHATGTSVNCTEVT